MVLTRPAPGDPPATGIEWVVDAFGCSPDALRSEDRLRALFSRIVGEYGLHALAPATVHAFPSPGGVTGVLLLSESHLACHTFPEYGYAALNLYTCRPRPSGDFEAILVESFGAARVAVRPLVRGGIHATGSPP